MSDFFTDHETGVHYCGGEMDDWSDRQSPADVLPAHAARMVPDDARSVLLVGARAAAAAVLLAGDRAITVVVRGETDAERIAATGVSVHCGDLGRWTPPGRFDVAIALDPPDEVLPPSCAGMGHLEFVHVVEQWADTTIAYVENAAGLASLDRQERGPAGNRDFAALGASYDLRPPTAADLARAHRRPTALVFGTRECAAVVVAPERLDEPVTTLIRSRTTTDLRWDALLDSPAAAATGWLLGGDVRSRALTIRTLTGTTTGDAAPTLVGTPLETPLLRLLRADDRPRLTTALDTYARWAGGNPAALPRDLVAADQGFAPIETDGPRVCLAEALVDVAAAVAGYPYAHRFGPELSRGAIARHLADMLTDSLEAEAVEVADAAYDSRPYARRSRPSARQEASSAEQLRVEVRAKDAQLSQLRTDLAKDRRHVRALERALATESGPRAKRAYFLMTAPTHRLAEAARRRLRR